MSIIKKARAVLAKWRDGSTPGPWTVRAESPTMGGSEWTVRTDGVPGIRMGVHEYQHGGTNLGLIVGTAGNPALWDAIDEMLRIADTRMARREEPAFVLHAERIAAAIIASDERMSA